MEQINIGIAREKKEDLRVQIQIVESEIKQLKENGDKYGRLPERQRVLDYLKNEWQKLDNNLGQTYSDVVRQSTQEINEEIKNQKEITHNDVSINEEWAIDSHYKQIASIEMELTKTNIKFNKELDPFQQVKLYYINSKKEINLKKKSSFLTIFTIIGTPTIYLYFFDHIVTYRTFFIIFTMY